jgi:hypothetical protein
MFNTVFIIVLSRQITSIFQIGDYRREDDIVICILNNLDLSANTYTNNRKRRTQIHTDC